METQPQDMKGKKMKTRALLPSALLVLCGALTVFAGDYGDNSACEACVSKANEDYDQCVVGWPEDPDCASKRDSAISSCQITVCIY